MSDRSRDNNFIVWAKKVKIRDDYTCRICGMKGVLLNSHHLNSWDFFINERYDVDNGVTLCAKHHEMFHSIYGSGKNTKFQFWQFEKSLEIIKKIAIQEKEKEKEKEEENK